MPVHFCEAHTEYRPSNSQSILWPQYNPQEHWHEIQGIDACKRDKKRKHV